MVRKRRRRIAAILLLCYLLWSASSISYARPETAGIPYEEGNSSSGYINVPHFISESGAVETISEGKKGIGKRFGPSVRTFVLPDSYDSRSEVNEAEVPYVLPARNQKEDGTCWAFSVCSAAETSMIKQNFFQEAKQLSPLQFTWFHYNRIQNPLGLSGPDRVFTSRNLLQAGGNEYLSIFALANWIGLVDEQQVPYETASDVVAKGLRSSLCYAENTACLKNAFWISLAQPDTVKEYIMEYGSALLPIYMQTQYYNSSTYGYYCNEARYNAEEESFSSNHMVTIVGWDDTYSRKNFKNMPQGDGAWLVKNSWGESWGMDGYFWISYYDKAIYEEVNEKTVGAEATFLEMTQPDMWDNKYSYDGGGGIDWYYFKDDMTEEPIPMALMANVYTAQYKEKLSAVSFYTVQEAIDYSIYIYCDVDTTVSPTGGKFPSAIVNGTLEKAGYHTIVLPEEIQLSPGMKFTVAIELRNQDEKEAVRLLADGDSIWNWVKFSSQVGKGESYYREPGKDWADVTEVSQSGWSGNFRIHALTRLENKSISGDVNADGRITSRDALEVLRIEVGLNTESYWEKHSGDLDRDGRLTSKDALQLLRIEIGIIN